MRHSPDDTPELARAGVSPSAAARTERTILSCRDLRKHFGATPALTGVDMRVREGEVVAVTGESGSGKSTLLLCLAGILRPDDGEVCFQGRRLTHLSDAELSELRRTHFGFVFQLGHLVPDLPAVVNVALPLLLRGARRAQAEQVAMALLNRLGVVEVAGRKPGEMSVGQAQRVAVARALILDPRIIFADEPTGSLDSGNATEVLDLLLQAARQRSAAVVLATHSPSVAGAADRTVVLRDGRVVDYR